MSERETPFIRRALVLEANGWGLGPRLADTLLRGALRLRGVARRGRWRQRWLGDRNRRLAYATDWAEAFGEHPQLAVTRCNVNDLIALSAVARRLRRFDLVVVLHTATAVGPGPLRRLTRALRRRRGALAVFMGNEYEHLGGLRGWLHEVRPDAICSQLPLASARWVYADFGARQVLSLPPGLAAARYPAGPPLAERAIDVGFAGDRYPLYIGDDDRNRLLEQVAREAGRLGLRHQLRFERLPRERWAAFLRGCRCVVGAEAGTAFLDPEGGAVDRARAWLRRQPATDLAALRARFFSEPTPRSGKAIAARHFEAIGSGCCQLLLRGDYNGLLRADEHYLAIDRDLANLPAVLEQARCVERCAAIAERARAHVLAEHTYRHRVDALLRAL